MTAVSREELQRRIAELDAALLGLIAAYPDAGDFNQAFAERADAIMDAAGIDDDTWAFERIDAMLAKYDLWRPELTDRPAKQ